MTTTSKFYQSLGRVRLGRTSVEQMQEAIAQMSAHQLNRLAELYAEGQRIDAAITQVGHEGANAAMMGKAC